MKKKLSKKGKLFLSNGIVFVILCIVGYIAALGETPFSEWFKIFSIYAILMQIVFTMMSLIIYYLSIVADALNKKYAEQEKDSKDKK